MSINPEAIIYLLLNTYYFNKLNPDNNEANFIKKEILEEAFYEVLDQIEHDFPNIDTTYYFLEELENFMSKYPSYLTFGSKETLEIINDLNHLSEIYEDSLTYLLTYVNSPLIYQILNITPNFKDYERIFTLNHKFIHLIEQISKAEINHQNLSNLIKELDNTMLDLDLIILDLHQEDITRLTTCLRFLEPKKISLSKLLTNIIFSTKKEDLAPLYYSLLRKELNNYQYLSTDESFDEEVEITYIFSKFTCLLAKLIKTLPDCPIKSNLIMRKNYLLASPLSDILEHFLTNEDISSYTPSPFFNIINCSKTLFSIALNYSNLSIYTDSYLIKNPPSLIELIMKCLFLKVFFQENQNKANEAKIMANLNHYLNNNNYQTLTTYLNNITFLTTQNNRTI